MLKFRGWGLNLRNFFFVKSAKFEKFTSKLIIAILRIFLYFCGEI